MQVRVRLYGSLAPSAGARRMELTVPDGACVGDVIAELKRTCPDLAVYLTENRTLAAHTMVMVIGGEEVGLDHGLSAGAEILLLPPMTGGCL